jgi:hypothetical protein
VSGAVRASVLPVCLHGVDTDILYDADIYFVIKNHSAHNAFEPITQAAGGTLLTVMCQIWRHRACSLDDRFTTDCMSHIYNTLITERECNFATR